MKIGPLSSSLMARMTNGYTRNECAGDIHHPFDCVVDSRRTDVGKNPFISDESEWHAVKDFFIEFRRLNEREASLVKCRVVDDRERRSDRCVGEIDNEKCDFFVLRDTARALNNLMRRG